MCVQNIGIFCILLVPKLVRKLKTAIESHERCHENIAFHDKHYLVYQLFCFIFMAPISARNGYHQYSFYVFYLQQNMQ